MPGAQLVTRLTLAAGLLFVGAIFFHAITQRWDHAALFFVAFGATCGWIYTTHIARQNQIEKNTFDLIYSYNRDARYVGLRERVMSEFPPYRAIDAVQAAGLVKNFYSPDCYASKTPDQFPVAYHLIQIANFYEYLAIGINAGFLSDSLARKYFSSTLKAFYLTKACHLIREMRARTVSGPPGTISTSYSALLGLVRRWHPDRRVLDDIVVKRLA